MLGEVGENFAVEFDVGALETGNELVIRQAMLAGSGADLDLPKAAEVALFLTAALELVSPGVEHGFFGGAVLLASTPHKTLRVFEQSFAASVGSFSAFDSGHANLSESKESCDEAIG